VQITDADRDPVTGRILVDPAERAAHATAPATPAPPRRLSNRRGQPTTAPAARSHRGTLGLVGGLLGGLLLIALSARWLPGAAAPPAERAAPTLVVTAPAARPAIVPTTAPTATPAPPTATPEPAPTPEPQIIYVEKPCYSVTLDVYDGSRPLGQVTGTSCESQEAAQANADALAAAMRGGK